MANNEKRTSQLGITTTLQNTDRVVVLTNPNTAIGNTQTIALSNFLLSFANNLPGPFANDIVANNNGVAVKTLYFDTNGFLKIRMT